MLEGFASVKTLQGNIQRIGAPLQLEIWPGNHFSIGADPCPGSSFLNFAAQRLGDFVVMRFGVHFIAHFHQQSDVIVSAKTSIQAELGFDRLLVGQIFLLEAFEALPQGVDFIPEQLAAGLGLGQFALRNIECFVTTFSPFQGCLGSLPQ